MVVLNITQSNWSFEERRRINENWLTITSRLSQLQNSINILAGGTEVEVLLNNINAAIENANSTVQSLTDDVNLSIANVNDKIAEVNMKLTEIETATENANMATQETRSAITDARTAISDIESITSQFNFLGAYNNTVTYQKYNFVRLNKDTYVSLRTQTGVLPSDDGVNWRLTSRGGVDGNGAVSTINNISPEVDGNVILTTDNILTTNNRTLTDRLMQVSVSVEDFDRLAGENVDTNRIQRAIDFVFAKGGGTVLFESREYLINGLIEIRSNVDIVGLPGNRVKVADSTTGFYAAFRMKTVENCSVSGINYDGNYDRTNYNIADPNGPEIAVYVVDSRNIKITDNKFNTCGVWTISCEVSDIFPNIENVFIERNQINYRVGKNNRTPDAAGWTIDTTQIYCDVRNHWIRENIVFTNQTVAETAIETHRTRGVVEGNIIQGFKNGILIVPGFHDPLDLSSKLSVINNKITESERGITLWQISYTDLTNVIVSNNDVEIELNRFSALRSVQYAHGIGVLPTLPTASNKKIKNVLISSNNITFSVFTTAYASPDFTLNFPGISLKGWVDLESVSVKGNQIVNAPACGILVGVTSSAEFPHSIKSVIVENNTIVDAGRNTNIAVTEFNPRTGIRINGGADQLLTGLIVRNNQIIDNSATGNYFTRPLYNVRADLDKCIVADNAVLANGYIAGNYRESYTIPIAWDSQVGAPTMSRNGYFIRTANGVKLETTIDFTAVAEFTSGFGCYVTLPTLPKQSGMYPINIIGNAGTAVVSWYLDVVANTRGAYIRSIRADNTIGTLTQVQVQIGTKISINVEYTN